MAAMMDWNDALRVGHSAIDRDHEKLVGLINALGGAMESGKGQDICASILNELVNYTKTHFAMEEQLMTVHQYESAAAHRAEHAKLIQEVVAFQDELRAGTSILSVSLLHFLMEWLTRHILVSDKALATALARG